MVLRINTPALAGLPWEATYDQAAGAYVCRQDQLVRHVPVASVPVPLRVRPPLRILGVVSSPRGLPALDVEKEQGQLARALARPTAQGLAEYPREESSQIRWQAGRWRNGPLATVSEPLQVSASPGAARDSDPVSEDSPTRNFVVAVGPEHACLAPRRSRKDGPLTDPPWRARRPRPRHRDRK